jgi:hypothetical protein
LIELKKNPRDLKQSVTKKKRDIIINIDERRDIDEANQFISGKYLYSLIL